MRRKEKAMTNEQIDSLLKRENVLRLGLAVDNKPYIVPLNYGYKNGVFYVHCAKEGKKIDMIKKNDLVCVEVEGASELVTGDIACKYTMNFESVIGYGQATILESKDDVKEGLDVLMAQFSDLPFTYNEKVMAKVSIIKITMDELVGKSSK